MGEEEAEVSQGWGSQRSQLPEAPDIWSRSYPAVAVETGLPVWDKRPQWGWWGWPLSVLHGGPEKTAGLG